MGAVCAGGRPIGSVQFRSCERFRMPAHAEPLSMHRGPVFENVHTNGRCGADCGHLRKPLSQSLAMERFGIGKKAGTASPFSRGALTLLRRVADFPAIPMTSNSLVAGRLSESTPYPYFASAPRGAPPVTRQIADVVYNKQHILLGRIFRSRPCMALPR